MRRSSRKPNAAGSVSSASFERLFGSEASLNSALNSSSVTMVPKPSDDVNKSTKTPVSSKDTKALEDKSSKPVPPPKDKAEQQLTIRIRELEARLADKEETCLTLSKDRKMSVKEIARLLSENHRLKESAASKDPEVSDMISPDCDLFKQIQLLESALEQSKQKCQEMEEEKTKQSDDFHKQLNLIDDGLKAKNRECARLTKANEVHTYIRLSF